MKILFVYTLGMYETVSKPVQYQGAIHFGLSYVSSYLKSYGHETDLIVMTRETNRKVLDGTIEEFKPGLICFTSVCNEYPFVKELASYIKSKHSNLFLLLGGPHPTLVPDEVIKDSFDAVCIGEGEYPTLELVKQLEQGKSPSGIKSLWIKKDGIIEKNPTYNFIQDLDDLPYPDRDMWQKWILYPKSRQHVVVSRGCPFICTYCSNHALKKIADGKFTRFRSPSSVIKELEEVITKYPNSNEIVFESETIGADNGFVIRLCTELEEFNKKYPNFSYGANLRIIPKFDYSELFAAFKKGNFRFLNIGLESGSNRVRAEVLKRHYTNDDLLKVMDLARKYELKVCFYVIVGIPGETKEEFQETIDMCKKAQPDGIYLAIFFPYSGTDLYNYCEENGYIPDDFDPVLDRKKAIMDFPNFSKKEIQRESEWFYYKVYKGQKPLYVLLGYVLFRKIASNYFLNVVYGNLRRFALFEKMANRVKIFAEN